MTTIFYEILKTIRLGIVKAALVMLVLLNIGCTFYSLYQKESDGVSTMNTIRAAEETRGLSLEDAAAYYENRGGEYLENLMQDPDNIAEEAYLIFQADSVEYERLSALLTYEQSMEQIKTDLYAMRGASIFGAQDSYSQRLADLLYQTYEELHVEITDSDAPYGVDVVINNSYSWVLAMLGVFALCLVICRTDFEYHTATLLFTKKRTERKMGADKLGSICFLTFAVETLLFVSNLVVGMLIGLGKLSRPIQTISGFYECPLPLTIGMGMLFTYLLQLAASLIFAFLCFTVFNLFRNEKAGSLLLIILITLELILYLHSDHMWPKYINLVAFWNPIAYLGTLKGIRLIKWPVLLYVMAILCQGLLLFLFSLTGIFTYGLNKKQLFAAGVRNLRHAPKTKFTPLPVTAHEFRKLMLHSGGLVVCLIFLAVQSFIWIKADDFVYPYEYYYDRYIERFGGTASPDKWDAMQAEFGQIDFDAYMMDLDDKLSNGEIEEEVYERKLAEFSENPYQHAALEKIMEQYQAVTELNRNGTAADIINMLPWDNAIGTAGRVPNLITWIETLLASVLVFSAYGSLERRNGVDRLIAVSAMGQRRVFRRKLIPLLCLSSVLSLIGIVPRMIFLLRRYKNFSLHETVSCWLLQALPDWLLLYEFCIGVVIVYLMVNMLISLLCMRIAATTERLSAAILINTIAFCSLPMILLVALC